MKTRIIALVGIVCSLLSSSMIYASNYNPKAVQENHTHQLRIQKHHIAISKKDSYYGDTSEKTGRRKTVPVRGYYKKDGTYVNKHYRSPPRKK